MRRVRLAVVALLALLAGVASACSPGEPPTSEPTGPPPSVEFTASVTQDGDELRISYQLTNEDSTDLYVLNRVAWDLDPLQSRPELVYVTGRDGGTVEIAKRAFDMPDTDRVAWDSAAIIGATRLAPGESAAEEFTVALPLQRRHPYGNDLGYGEIRLPDPVESVVFCVGVVGEARQLEVSTPESPYFEHMPSTTLAQHVYCSPATPLE